MHSGVTAVLLLTSVGCICGGSQVPITSYVCTQPSRSGDDDQCNVSNGLRECEITNGVRPKLLDGDSVTPYTWIPNTNLFGVLDIPQGWCVGSVQMDFITTSTAPTPSINVSVHNMSQLSNNSHDVQAMHSSGIGDSDQMAGITSVVLNLTSLTCGRYLRIDMSSNTHVLLTEISVFGSSDVIPTPPSSASGNPTVTASSLPPSASSRTTTPPPPASSRTPPALTSVSGTPTTALSSISITPTTSSNMSGTNMPSSQSQTPPPPTPPPAAQDYVLPAAISSVAVLLLLVLIVIFVIVICIIARRHNSRKSLMMHRLSIHYRSTPRRKSSDNFKDDHQFVVDQQENAEIANHDADEKSGNVEDPVYNYAAVGPAESNYNIAQRVAEEPVAEGDIDRPPSQESIRSNEVSSKLTYGKVTWVHPSTLDHPYDSCNKGNATAASGGVDHYETPDRLQPGEVGNSGTGTVHAPPCDNIYELPPDCELLEEESTVDSGYRMLEDATAEARALGPSSILPLIDHTYESPSDTVATAQKTEKLREPDPSDLTYESVDQPSRTPAFAAAHTPHRGNPPEPSHPTQSVGVPHEDHIYSAVDKPCKVSASKKSSAASLTPSTDAEHVYSAVDMSRKTSASSRMPPSASSRKPPSASSGKPPSASSGMPPSASSGMPPSASSGMPPSATAGMPPSAAVVHSTDAAHLYSEVDKLEKEDEMNDEMDTLDEDFWGGSGNVEGDTMTEVQNVTATATDNGTVPTQEVAMGNVYAEVDFSKKKKAKKGKKQ